MNAAIESTGVAAARHISPADKFKTLLRREFWENRGGFFWAPVIASGISLFFALLGSIATLTLAHKVRNSVDGDFDGSGIHLGTGKTAEAFGFVGDFSMFSGIAIPMLVLVFVLFFYCLGAMYDERKDRSVLFWKSLPVSDTQTVLSKLAWALLLAPLLSIAIGVAFGIGHWILSALTIAMNGLPGAGAVFTQAHPFRTVFKVMSLLPVYAAWSLPTVGWLMFCSAWARSKPFLWAVLVPVMAAAIISWLDAIPGIEIPHGSVWYVMGMRGLLGIVPLTWFANPTVGHSLTDQLHSADAIDGPAHLAQSAQIFLDSSWSAFATADMWIGIGVGVAFIVAAIRMRRWRDEG